MSAKILVNGSYGSHEFNHYDPLDSLRALRAEAEDRVKAAQRTLENAENAVITAQVNLESAVAIRTRFEVAVAKVGGDE